MRILSAAGVVGPLAASAIICEQKNFINGGHIQFHLLERTRVKCIHYYTA